MTDLAVAAPPFVDLTFLGLEAVPRPGEERLARDLMRSPGGGAIIAVGAARLGLSTVLACPAGSDEAGEWLRRMLEADAVGMVAPHPGRTATTVVMPVDGERAMATYDPGVRTRPSDLEALAPRAVVGSFEVAAQAPAGAAVYVTVGDADAHAHAGRLPDVSGAKALLVNAAEAQRLAGADTPGEAARILGAMAPRVVVTVGAAGAISVTDGREIATEGFDCGPVVDTTGAGDLFVAAYVWADLRGAAPPAALSWATLYAAVSVTRPTGVGGAVTERELIEEGTRRGLPPLAAPAGHATSSSTSKEG